MIRSRRVAVSKPVPPKALGKDGVEALGGRGRAMPTAFPRRSKALAMLTDAKELSVIASKKPEDSVSSRELPGRIWTGKLG